MALIKRLFNTIFKFQNPLKKTDCTNVALLDFQMSSLRSPVLDLSQLIYSVASEKQLRHCKQLIDHYYSALSKNIKEIGSCPEKLFSFQALRNHWRKYSAYGAILSPFIAMYCFIDKENTADFGVCQTLKNATNKPEYMRRVVAVARHFVEFEL